STTAVSGCGERSDSPPPASPWDGSPNDSAFRSSSTALPSPCGWEPPRRGGCPMTGSRCGWICGPDCPARSEEHTSELQSRENLVCRLLLEKKKKKYNRREWYDG